MLGGRGAGGQGPLNTRDGLKSGRDQSQLVTSGTIEVLAVVFLWVFAPVGVILMWFSRVWPLWTKLLLSSLPVVYVTAFVLPIASPQTAASDAHPLFLFGYLVLIIGGTVLLLVGIRRNNRRVARLISAKARQP